MPKKRGNEGSVIPRTEFPLRNKTLLTKVIVVCDRYSAYEKLARLNAVIILAFCWAHVR